MGKQERLSGRMSLLARTTTRLTRPAVPTLCRALATAPTPEDHEMRYQIPNYGPVEEIAECQKWKYISIAGFAVCGVLTFMTFSLDHHTEPDPPAAFKKIRKKPFPWK